MLRTALFLALLMAVAQNSLVNAATNETCDLTSWNQWGECNHECGNFGNQARSRVVIAYRLDGQPCQDPLISTQPCNRFGCTAANCENNEQYESQCAVWKASGFCGGVYLDFMKANCRRSCDLCVGRTPAPVVTAAPTNAPTLYTPAPTSVCSNVASTTSCNVYAASGLCGSPTFKDWMSRNCALACGLCNTASTCNDLSAASECLYWQQQGWCKVGAYTAFMASSCARTCGMCPTDGLRCPNVAATTDCKTWAAAGFCTASQYKGYMSTNCAGTCNTCGYCADEETASNCGAWNAAGYCTAETNYLGYMKANCAKTCRFCFTSLVPVTPPPTVLQTPAPTVPVTAAPTMRACQNLRTDAECNSWAASGYCLYSDIQTSQYVKVMCPASCFYYSGVPC